MSDTFEIVQTLKEKARTATANGKYDKALACLEDAIDLLSSELKEIEDSGIAESEEDRHELAVYLADCYGMEGGVYRRSGDLDKAIEKYDEGYKYEKDKSYHISNSYNLINSIVVRILKDPNNFTAQKTVIQNALEAVKKQVERKRSREWWAWSDLGQLYLLSGKIEEALQSYEKFKTTGARIQNYESTIAVLKELENALNTVDPFVSQGISKAMWYLEENTPAR